MLENPGLYVHFPWCVKKCPYCDFNSHPLSPAADFDAYASALQQDLSAQLGESQPRFASAFLGGGTPSLCPPEHLARIISALPLTPDAEVTMEANPGTLEHADFGAYRAAGINRLSLGAQSFNAGHLLKLGRIHTVEDIPRVFAAARAGGFDNINLDIMWGLPGQTVADAMADLNAAIALGPEHLSWYQLTIAPKTEFARRVPVLPVEDTLGAMETAGLARLRDAGYQRYEVSAYARADRRCAHNLNYWTFGDYLGIGAGAHGKRTDGDFVARTEKARQPRLYLKDPAQTGVTQVDPAALAFEFLLNALRLEDGVAIAVFEARTGLSWDVIAERWATLVDQGLVKGDRCATTARGYRYLDSVLERFLT